MTTLAALASWSAPSSAQIWPQRSVRFIVTLGPASGTDIGTRLLSDHLSRKWGQPVVVENKPGGDGIVAINAFVAANDDHVLLAAPSSSFTAHPHLHENLSYKPSDLQPIARVSNTVIVVAVPASLNAASLKDLVATARREPGKLDWVGTTGAVDFVFAGFLKSNGLSMTKVPYRNPVEAVNDLGGRDACTLIWRRWQSCGRNSQAGKIKLLTITNNSRAPRHPDVPTAKEAGHDELTFDGLVGFFGPSGMPLGLRERIAADVEAVIGGRSAIAQRLNPDRAVAQSRRAGARSERGRRAACQARCPRQGARHQARPVRWA